MATRRRDATTLHPREQILERSLELFFRQGFRGTTVREIMLACGLTSGALYNHFQSKEDVLFTLIQRTNDAGTKFILDLVEDAADDPVTQLYAAVRASALYYAKDRAGSLVSTFEYIHLPEDQRATVVKQRREGRIFLEQKIQAGLDAGVFSLPENGGKNAVKLVATAVANLALRPSEVFGPTAALNDERLSDFHAELALQMVNARRRPKR